MAKQLVFDETARRSLKKGVDRLAEVVVVVAHQRSSSSLTGFSGAVRLMSFQRRTS